MIRRLVTVSASILVLSNVASAQAQPPPTDQLTQAAQAARDAAQAARDAALATKQLAEAIAGKSSPAPAAAPTTKPAAKKAPAPKPSAWNYTLGLNLISDTGNATAFSGKLTGKVQGNWAGWGVTIGGDAAYGESKPVGTTTFTTTAMNADGLLRGDRKVSSHFSGYVLAGAGTDHVAAIEALAYGEGGVSIVWLERKEADFTRVHVSTDFGIRYAHEADYRYFPTATETTLGPLGRPNGGNIYAPRVAFSFQYGLSKSSVFSEDAEVLEDVVDPKDVRFTSTTAISAQLTKGFAISLGFKVRYIGIPAAGALPTDTELSGGIVWAF